MLQFAEAAYGHHAIFVDTGGRSPAITKIYYFNGSSAPMVGTELVPNADYGVDTVHPIGQEGRYFVYGVSTRWTWALGHWSWHDTWRWRIYYNC